MLVAKSMPLDFIWFPLPEKNHQRFRLIIRRKLAEVGREVNPGS
jgi:hypothetical protein